MGGGRNRRAFGSNLGNKREQSQTGILDDLAEFEDYRREVLEAVRKDIARGLNPKQIREKYQAQVQARLLTLALTSKDEKIALSASKDLIDRQEGRATERKEITGKLDLLSDEQLDAKLQTELMDLGLDGSNKSKSH